MYNRSKSNIAKNFNHDSSGEHCYTNTNFNAKNKIKDQAIKLSDQLE